jgi:hypothetical protein
MLQEIYMSRGHATFSATITAGTTTLTQASTLNIFLGLLNTEGNFIAATIFSGGNDDIASITVVWSGVLSLFSGLTTGQLYYYNPGSKTPTTAVTDYVLGYALSATQILFEPFPRYY